MPYGKRYTRTARRTTKRKRTVARPKRTTTGVLGYNAFNLDDTYDHIKSPIDSVREDVKKIIRNRQEGEQEVKRIMESNRQIFEDQRARKAAQEEKNSWGRWAETAVPGLLGATTAAGLSLLALPVPISAAIGGAVDLAGVGLSELITGHNHNFLPKLGSFGTDLAFQALKHPKIPKELRYGLNIGRSIYERKPGKAAYFGSRLRERTPGLEAYLRGPLRFEYSDYIPDYFKPNTLEEYFPVEESYHSPVKLKKKRTIRLPTPVKEKRFGVTTRPRRNRVIGNEKDIDIDRIYNPINDPYSGLLGLYDALSDTSEYEQF